MENERLLYILFDKVNPFLKIGIATNKDRINQLSRCYTLDIDRSIFYSGKNEDILNMERILHKTFSNNNIIREGSGGTEWFEDNIFYKATTLINQYVCDFNFVIGESKKCKILFNHKPKRKATKKINSDKKQHIYDDLWFDTILNKQELSLIVDLMNLNEPITFDLVNNQIDETLLHKISKVSIIRENRNLKSFSCLFVSKCKLEIEKSFNVKVTELTLKPFPQSFKKYIDLLNKTLEEMD